VTPAGLARALDDFVASREPRWRALLQELIRIPSTFEHEQAVVARVAAHIGSLGVPVQWVAHHSQHLTDEPAAQPPFSANLGRYSLATRLAGSGRGQSLILSTHLDIVHEGNAAEWTHPPFSGHVDEAAGLIHGRGAMDDKAGVVAALALLEVVAHLPIQLAGDVIFQFVLEDETTGNGTLLCLKDDLRADGAFIIDGTRLNRAINQHAGNLEFGVVVKGRPASVAVSHVGINAAEMLARLSLHLRDAVFALNATRVEPWTQFPSPFQISLQHIESTGHQLTLPDLARARFYMTFPPPFTLAGARALVMEAAEEFSARNATEGPVQFDWGGFATEPVSADCAPLGDVLQQSAAALGMEPIAVGPSTGTSDLRHFVAAGIPCLLYGPGDGGNPHRLNEFYRLEDLRRVVMVYAGVIQRWCGTSG
jgi:acetylornithine deacetylase